MRQAREQAQLEIAEDAFQKQYPHIYNDPMQLSNTNPENRSVARKWRSCSSGH